MDGPQNNSSVSLFRFLILETVPKISLSLVALSYVFGFIIVNTYLGSLGIASIAILKAKYIAAGAVFLVFVLLSGIIIYPLIRFFMRPQTGEKGALKWEDALYSAGSLAAMIYLLMHIAPETLVANHLYLPSVYAKIGIALWIICVILLVISTSPLSSGLLKLRAPLYFLTMGAVAYVAIDHKIFSIFLSLAVLEIWAIVFAAGILKVTTQEKKISDMAFTMLLLLGSLLTLSKVYSDNLYPKIMNQFGGGKPVAVTLLLIRDENSGLELLFHDDQKLSERLQDVTLLDEDADYFFIQKQTGQQIETIRIRKPLVNAVIRQKSGDLPFIPKSTSPKTD